MYINERSGTKNNPARLLQAESCEYSCLRLYSLFLKVCFEDFDIKNVPVIFNTYDLSTDITFRLIHFFGDTIALRYFCELSG